MAICRPRRLNIAHFTTHEGRFRSPRSWWSVTQTLRNKYAAEALPEFNDKGVTSEEAETIAKTQEQDCQKEQSLAVRNATAVGMVCHHHRECYGERRRLPYNSTTRK
eukprot:gnl/Spiro4/28747_TR14226_c0_g1_i1.p4 gnl/Spiro4/28747_TR14226_c0_g1~~gnl/Spiro4/28747_TR14226_c0_g1_i1.p4  ORF type:complete len:107 (-),score=9.36 gnl/Spiro4/28747_TR14226_c0_g1_i1:224-544(-)